MDISHIHKHILMNWDKIKNDKDIMNVLDVDTNNMCRYYKINNPELDDKYIQSHTLTFLFLMLFIVSQPINNNIIDID